MQFHVGPYVYTLVVSDREIFNDQGDRLEAIAVENRRLMIVSRTVEPARREEVAAHEFTHAWSFHTPLPQTEEERCQLTATIARQFYEDIERQGGREALIQMPMCRVPHLGRPPAATAPALLLRESFDCCDRRPCGNCDADTMAGSIHTSEPVERGGQFHVERWFRCDACGIVQTWNELATSDGRPTGQLVPVPRPKILRGLAARLWIAEHAEAVGA